jgi:hypothetical protein
MSSQARAAGTANAPKTDDGRRGDGPLQELRKHGSVSAVISRPFPRINGMPKDTLKATPLLLPDDNAKAGGTVVPPAYTLNLKLIMSPSFTS